MERASRGADPPEKESSFWTGNAKFSPNELCSFIPAAILAFQCKFSVLVKLLLGSLVAFTLPVSLHLEPGLD